MNMKYEMKGSVHGHDFKIVAEGKGRPYDKKTDHDELFHYYALQFIVKKYG